MDRLRQAAEVGYRTLRPVAGPLARLLLNLLGRKR
jgi:hypothetical protein